MVALSNSQLHRTEIGRVSDSAIAVFVLRQTECFIRDVNLRENNVHALQLPARACLSHCGCLYQEATGDATEGIFPANGSLFQGKFEPRQSL